MRVAVLMAGMALVVAPSAFAHANLSATTPANDAVLDTSPSRVTLRFDEPVESAFGSVRVYDGTAKRVDDGHTTRPAPNVVAVGLDGTLRQGTYTVAWRVVSADSHPVHGAFVFHVGKPGPNAGGVGEEVLGAEGGARSVSWSFTVIRFLGFALILLTAGGAAALAVWVPSRTDAASARRRLWLVLVGTSLALVPVTLAAIGLQGASAAGIGLEGAVRWSLIQDVVETRFGRVALVRVLLALAVAVVAVVASRSPGRTEQRLALVACSLSALVAATPAVSGHAQVDGSLAVLADAVHVEAAAIWAGGLAFLLLLLLWSRGRRWEVATDAAPGFSAVAPIAVAALIAAGAVNGFLEVRSFTGLWETTYGRLLLVKIALVVPLLGLGAFNNRVSVPRLRAGVASVLDRRRFLLATGTELAILVVVVAVTTALVAEPPAKARSAASGPVSVDSPIGPFDLNLVVDPARAGGNEVHLYLLQRSGQPAAVDEARVSASLPSASIGRLRMTPVVAGPGHFVVPKASFPFAGLWRLRVDVREGDFDQWTVELQIPIRKDT
jgi:copper transport protein